MRKLLVFLFVVPLFSNGENFFYKYFLEKSMRFDFILGGNAQEVRVFPQKIKQEPYWAGSIKNLVDTFNYGTYRYKVFDKESGKLIFSKGFCTLFQEWQATAEAKKIDRTFYHSAIIPFPKKDVTFQIEARQWNGDFKNVYKIDIDPNDYFILKEPLPPLSTKVFLDNGPINKKVDLVILAEGYTEEEETKFWNDAKRVINYLFEEEPFKSEKKKFNVRAVMTPSVNSGTDIPGEGIYKNTCFNSTFYTFDVPRYLTVSDMEPVYDAAGTVPYDHIYILVNTERYGGGGFYNFVSVCSSNHQLTRKVFVHEFGHGFAGLGDEYYTSSVAYEDFYNLKVEPWEPNITTLVSFENKWKEMIEKDIPVPTPRCKEFIDVVGAFEGGGYMSRGIYSPYIDCRMKSNEAKGFCPVCSKAIKRVIDYYCN